MGIKGSQMKSAYSQLQLGMSKERVISLLGAPDSTKVSKEGAEVWGWYSKEFKGMFRGGFIERTISVTFEENVVSEFEGNNINSAAW